MAKPRRLAKRPPPNVAAQTPTGASQRSSTQAWKHWRATPTAACRRSLAGQALYERPSTSTSRPARSPRRRDGVRGRHGRRGDEERRAAARRTGGGTRTSTPSDVATARSVPRPACDQHGPALGRGASPASPPMLDQLEPLIERGQKKGVFRRDLPVVWHLAVLRAIVHAASTEIRGGRLAESDAELRC